MHLLFCAGYHMDWLLKLAQTWLSKTAGNQKAPSTKTLVYRFQIYLFIGSNISVSIEYIGILH